MDSGAEKSMRANCGKSSRERRCGTRATRSDWNDGRVRGSHRPSMVSGFKCGAGSRVSRSCLLIDEPTDDIEELYEELEDPAGAGAVLSRVSPTTAGWLGRFIVDRVEKERERAGDEINQELKVDSFRYHPRS